MTTIQLATVHGLYLSMPASYDPDEVTEEDIERDGSIAIESETDAERAMASAARDWAAFGPWDAAADADAAAASSDLKESFWCDDDYTPVTLCAWRMACDALRGQVTSR